MLRDSSARAEKSPIATELMHVSPISSSNPQRLATAAAQQRAAVTPFTSVLRAISDRLTDAVGEGERLALSLVGLAQQSAPAVGESLTLAGGLLDPQFNFDAALEAFQDAVHRGLRAEGIDALDDLTLQVDAQGRIVIAEDQGIVENQRPEELPLDLTEELHLKGPDAPALAYRRMMRELGVE